MRQHVLVTLTVLTTTLLLGGCAVHEPLAATPSHVHPGVLQKSLRVSHVDARASHFATPASIEYTLRAEDSPRTDACSTHAERHGSDGQAGPAGVRQPDGRPTPTRVTAVPSDDVSIYAPSAPHSESAAPEHDAATTSSSSKSEGDGVTTGAIPSESPEQPRDDRYESNRDGPH